MLIGVSGINYVELLIFAYIGINLLPYTAENVGS